MTNPRLLILDEATEGVARLIRADLVAVRGYERSFHAGLAATTTSR